MAASSTNRRSAVRRQLLRGPRDRNFVLTRASLETVEPRRLLSMTVYNSGGQQLGTLETYTPPGGIQVADPAKIASGGRATSDANGKFDIEITFSGGLTASQQAAFTTAANRWQQIIVGDIPDVGASPTQYGAAVDDLRIDASGVAIDGVNGVLGQAGPNYVRNTSNLPISGTMQFDTADLAQLESTGQLVNVITHEMGHVLGYGTIWNLKGLLTGAGGDDPEFTGVAATAEYRKFIGNNAVTSVPVENSGASGTRDAHWRESVFNTELLTGYLSNGVNPLSRMSAAQFIDLGYPIVNVDAADLYTVSNPLPVVATLIASPSSTLSGSTFTLSLRSAPTIRPSAVCDSITRATASPACRARGTAASRLTR